MPKFSPLSRVRVDRYCSTSAFVFFRHNRDYPEFGIISITGMSTSPPTSPFIWKAFHMKGKVEAVMKTIKRDFQAEAQQAGFKTLEELNSALWAWLDVEYNRRNHSSTGEPPAVRFEKGPPQDHRRVQDLQWFENLFLLQVFRKVAKWGTIKFEGNQYHTEATAGSTIEVRYNPFNLRKVWRFENGKTVETLGLKKLGNSAVEKLPEERQA